MKKINLSEVSEVLSEKELKNVLGGVVTTSSGGPCNSGSDCNGCPSCGKQCEGIQIGSWCDGGLGICKCWPDPMGKAAGAPYCKICFH